MSEAYQRFFKSLHDFGVYHDGLSYDLEALRQLSGEELKTAEIQLIQASGSWPQAIEGLDVIGSPLAIATIKTCLSGSDTSVRVEAARRLLARQLITTTDVETMLIEMLKKCNAASFISIRPLAQEYPTPTVKRLLLWNVVYGDDSVWWQAAELAYSLYGLTSSPERFKGVFRSGGSFRLMAKLGLHRRALIQLCRAVGEDTTWITPATPTSPPG